MKAAIDSKLLQRIYSRRSGWYDFYHSLVTAKSDQRGRRLVVNESVRPGDRVLDAGSGTGSTAILAARRAGPEGRVVLFDMTGGMLAVARRKLAAAGLSNRIDVKQGDILHMPFSDNSFDAVLSTYSVCPLYSPEQGALELYRVLKPGGRLGIAHSAEPESGVIRRLACVSENLIWRFPRLSLGCRAVSVLPALLGQGAGLKFKRSIGFPLWPFLVFVVEKPHAAKPASNSKRNAR